MNAPVVISHHARARLAERVGWPEDALEALAAEALAEGIPPRECPAHVALWLAGRIAPLPERGEPPLVLVHRARVFLFGPAALGGWFLVTVFPLPRDVRKSKRMRRMSHDLRTSRSGRRRALDAERAGMRDE